MTDWNYDLCDPIETDLPSMPRKIFSRTLPVLAAFSFSALVALRVAGNLAVEAYNAPPLRVAVAPEGSEAQEAGAAAAAAAAAAKTAAAKPTAAQSQKVAADMISNPYGALFDPNGNLSKVPQLFADDAPIGPSFSPLQAQPLFVMVDPIEDASQNAGPQPSQQVAALDEGADDTAEQAAATESAVPLPPARPTEFSARERVASTAGRHSDRARAAASHLAPARTYAKNDPRSFFQKLFQSHQDEQKGPQLAYASPEGGGLSGLFSGGESGQHVAEASGQTAVYDISDHTVYLPNGKKLEAHSGLGPYKDDPRHVNVRMRGATPPHLYSLRLREHLFHGVRALRLTPIGGGTVYGRSGLLAHRYMLGPHGDSNGCVSFRNYPAFLDAYLHGQVKKLMVVSHL